jgi:hypothetical protein
LRSRLLIGVAACVAFALSLAGSFHFDDYALFQDPSITSPSGWLEVWRPEQTRPLTYFTFWLNYGLGGRNSIGYHAVNLALHVAASLLVFAVVIRLISPRVALIGALIFAVHPIQTEPVAYIFARGALLMTVLCLVALYVWLRGRLWVAVACFCAALLAKEECAAFPLALIALHQSMSRSRKERAAIAAMLIAGLAAGLRVIGATATIHGSGAGFAAGASPATYASMQGIVIWRYLRLFAAPWGFTVDPEIDPAPILLRLLAWITLAAMAVVAARYFKNGQPGFWFIAGLLLLLPSSSIFPAVDLAADRRMYLPMIGFSTCAAFVLARFDGRIAAAIVIVLAATGMRYSLLWRTEQSLWTEAVTRAPHKVRPRIQLARASDAGRALEILSEAQRMAPDDPDVASEQGRVYMAAGTPAQALGAFGRALALSPSDAIALNNRGVALFSLGQVDAARQDFERAIKVDPCLFDARLNLGKAGVSSQPPADCRYTPEQQAQLRAP